MKKVILIFSALCCIFSSCNNEKSIKTERDFNGKYENGYLNRLSFPIGGIGAGMICLDGTGSFSHVSVRNKPDVDNSPFMFAALSVKGIENGAKILEGLVQSWKIFGDRNSANGSSLFGCPRFEKASFEAKFPFGTINFKDPDIPLEVNLTGWSPFIPTDADNSSLPVGALEYTFKNTTNKPLEAVFSFHSDNFMRMEVPSEWGGQYIGNDSIMKMDNGFILEQSCLPGKPHYKGEFAIFTDEPNAVVDYCWFRGGWFDNKTILWKNISEGKTPSTAVTNDATGASIYVPFKLEPKQSKTIKVLLSWYVPHSDIRVGWSPDNEKFDAKVKAIDCKPGASCCPSEITSGYYEPWYSGRYKDINEVSRYWKINYQDLKSKSELFSNTFYSSDIPDEVKEAVAANLAIIKSPTVLRQKDGKLWAWEGCHDKAGCCYGSCTHVWNYAQAIPHLFPSLERTLRESEFTVSQDTAGHQTFRTNLPIREAGHGFYAAADGQLGGIMKVYRDWRISGDTEWLKKLFPSVKSSMDYAIKQWDPRRTGTIEEPHHNTYDIEFWGPDGMCTGFYLNALNAFVKMASALGEKTDEYKVLITKSKQSLENELFNGEYFVQKVKWEGLTAKNPVEASKISIGGTYTAEALEILKKEGPKYQYGIGCLSDGALGFWIAQMCGLDEMHDNEKVKSHLLSIYKYNFKTNLAKHANPQRAGYAYGNEGGLLICSWPKGGQPTFPFVYSNEVWTGIEYQVASHLMLMGEVQKGYDIVKAARKRYDGRVRDPFDEYECGHWYARAMSSYGLLQGLTGFQYDAIDKCLYIDSKIGEDFKCFFSCDTGFGLFGLKNGKPFIKVVYGNVNIKKCLVSGKEMECMVE